MMRLVRLLMSWSVRRILLFILIVAAMVAFVKVKEAYDSLPVLSGEIEALRKQETLIDSDARRQVAEARAALGEIERLEQAALQQRLARVRSEIARLDSGRLSRTGFALQAVRGNSDAIARDLSAAFRLELLRREEAVIAARLDMIGRGNQVNGLAERIAAFDARTGALGQRIAQIEREHPVLSRVEDVPLVRRIRGPWRELRAARQELESLRVQRERAATAQRAWQASLAGARRVYEQQQSAMRAARAPVDALRQRIAGKEEQLAGHWASRVWEAVKPVLGWALWLTILIIVAPPAIKAFWFFVVAPAAARMEPVRIRPDRTGDIFWAADRIAGVPPRPGSAVSWRLALRPDEELLVRPDYLQSSVNDARFDSKLLLSREIPFGSLAAGLVGLTRIRAESETSAAISATRDLIDEVGAIEVPDGSAVVFKPRNLIGIVQPIDRPMRLERIWRIRQLSSWLTLHLRHLVFHGPCALVVKGARGIALEPAEGGRRVAGAATMGWSTGLSHSVRRSETFLAYLTGKQSLFNDSFEGAKGKVISEERPRAGAQSGLFGRGLEGIGDAMLKIVGL